MRIACLQFSPQVGDVENNLNRADAVLSRAEIDNLDLLVLPELPLLVGGLLPVIFLAVLSCLAVVLVYRPIVA